MLYIHHFYFLFSVLPIEDCIENIVETSEDYADQNALMITNGQHEALENITDITLCVKIHKNNNARELLYEDMCYAPTTENISEIQNKQRDNQELSKIEATTLIEYFFDHCSNDYETRYRNKEVVVNVRIVPLYCDPVFIEVGEMLQEKTKASEPVVLVGYVISSIGLLGAILSLSAFCRPSFLQQHHIGYLCIGRSVFDICMLAYSTLQLYFRDDVLDDVSVKVASASTTETDVKNIVRCCAFFLLCMPAEIGTVLLTMALSLQRMIAVTWPFKAKVYLNSTVAKKIIIAVVCVSIIVPIVSFVILFATSRGTIGHDYMCALFSIEKDVGFYFSIAWSCIVIAVPWIIIVGLTAVTMYQLAKARRNRARMAASNQNTGSQSQLQNQNLITVLLLVFSFLFALVPEILLNTIVILNPHLDLVEKSLNLENWIYVALALKSSPGVFIYFGSNLQFRQIILGYVKCNCN